MTIRLLLSNPVYLLVLFSSLRQVYAVTYTRLTTSIDGITFSPYPAPTFSGGSEQWVKEDEKFQAEI